MVSKNCRRLFCPGEERQNATTHFNEHGLLRLDCLAPRFFASEVYREGVIAVDADSLDPVAGSTRRDAVACVLLRGRRRNRETVEVPN